MIVAEIEALGRALMRVHKLFLGDERVALEIQLGHQLSPLDFFNRLTQGDEFNWMKPLSSLLSDIDEFVDETKKPKKNVQDAHEAIRPSSLLNDPEEIKDSLDKDQYRLYKLIWTRMLASQMAPAVYDKTNAEMQAGPLTFRAGGERLNFPGFTAVYRDRENKNTMLPEMEEGEILEKKKIVKEQKFTTPPTRYNEGTLISKLEENGIGRPSTYAPTISTIKNR